MPAPRVSVVIPAYNVAGCIGRALDSVLAQSWTDREIMVVDDGSTDTTPAVLRGYGGAIRTVRQENAGLSAARNRGVAESAGELIAFLDADDHWLPEKLRKQVELMDREPETGFCSTATRAVSPDGGDLGIWSCPETTGSALEIIFTRNAAVPGSGSGVMVRRSLLDQVGGFDASLRSLEDVDMWMRLAAVSGYACIPEPLTVIVKSADSMSGNLEVMRASALRVMRKNRHLLPRDSGRALWQAAYAGVLADYAKWEYRADRRLQAVLHLLEAFARAPIQRGRMILGLLSAMATGQRL